MKLYEITIIEEVKYQVEANTMKEALKAHRQDPFSITERSGKAKLIKQDQTPNFSITAPHVHR